MSAMEADAEEEIARAVQRLRDNGVDLEEIRKALNREADKIFEVTYDWD